MQKGIMVSIERIIAGFYNGDENIEASGGYFKLYLIEDCNGVDE